MRYRAVLAALLYFSGPAFSWGPEGHSLVARIAWLQMTPAARARAEALLEPGETLPGIASWADDVRRTRSNTAPWHYVNIPMDQTRFDARRDCAEDGCIVAVINNLRKTLEDPGVDLVKQREALKFLVHFIGDLHQPLHCSNPKDRGGNDVAVRFQGRLTNLHSLWDSGLLGRMAPEEELLTGLSSLSARNSRKWSKGKVEKWAEQSHAISRKTVYGKLPHAATGTPVPIDDAYEQLARPVIGEQIAKAGARLAFVLNAALR